MPADTVGKVSVGRSSHIKVLCLDVISLIRASFSRQSPARYTVSLCPLDAVQSLQELQLIYVNAKKAAVAWEAGKDLSIEDIEVEAPKAHEVRIEVYYTGVCHTGILPS